MLLIVGLGNPGAEYKDTRHNVGFMAVDEIADKYSLSGPKKRFHGQVYEGEIGDTKVLVLKPQTFMNKSGSSVAEAASFYKVPTENVIVFYDELDLIPGKLRVKKAGSDGGHNGIKSLDSHIGKDYWRVRVGIGHPGHKDAVTGYVLSKFKSGDKKIIKSVIGGIAEAFPLLAEGEKDKFMTKVALNNGEGK